MLSRLDAARIVLFLACVFALGLVDFTNARAESPVAGQGTGPMPPPSAPPGANGGYSVAYAVPRNAPSPNVEIILPQPLAPSDVAIYGRILTLQRSGDFAEADRLMGRLEDTSLIGTVLADKYLGPNYITSPAELRAWYAKYGDQPEAPAIYHLMQLKMPASALPAPPQVALLPETTISAGAAAPPVFAVNGSAWRERFMQGIGAWRAGNLAGAGADFSAAARMSGISGEDRAAGYFWAARAALRLEQPELYLSDLHQASWDQDSFYGMLAGRLLGQGFGPTGIAATLTEADVTAVVQTTDGQLALELLQVGETRQASLALRALWPQMQADPGLGRAVMAVAARAGLVDVTIAIAGRLPSPVDEIAGARLPLPALHPVGGFTISPSLVYALARTESGFNADAVSPVGARGLMQLMPQTAYYVREREGLSGSIYNPSDNLALGQGYVRYLSQQPGIDGNLLAILASYNAGPGAASAWYDRLRPGSDPLMFIETIPNDQTRRFVHQVLADSWIYAEEIGLRPESLDALAEGNFPQLDVNFATAWAN